MNCGLRTLIFLLCLPQLALAQWPTFVDVTAAKGISGIENISYLYGNGAAIADFDTDGDLDFFLCTKSGMPDRLYVNNGDGSFEERAAALGIGSTTRTRVALWFDYDGDQDLDLVTLSDCYLQGCNDPISIYLYEQQANGSFMEIARNIGLAFGDKYITNASIAAAGLSAGDLNNDGFLDLLVSVWGGPLTYFENTTNGSFADQSSSSLLGPDFRYRWQPMMHDFNGDGFQDIYVTVDFDANELWMNNGDGTFSDQAAATFSNSAFNDMGLSLGDYDNDGDMDLYATNISREDNGVLRHNILLKNLRSSTGVLMFDEIANDLQVGASGWDWGTTFFEANNDGRLDLATTNGWEPGEWALDASRLWLNLGDGLFGDISGSSQFNDLYDATSLMAFDMDRDGDLDLLQTLKANAGTDAPLILYENTLSNTANPRNYIVIKPRSDDANHFGIGALVKITSGSTTQMRLISAGTSLYGQEPAEAFFGTGDETVLTEVKVLWPDGTETVIKDVAVNQELTVFKEQSLSLARPQEQRLRFYPNPVNQQLTLELQESEGQLHIHNALGQQIDSRKLEAGVNRISTQTWAIGLYWLRVVMPDAPSQAFSIVKD